WLTEVRSPTPAVRRKASRVLRLVGPEADQAAPALLMALRSDDLIIRGRLAWALARLGPKQVPLLAAALAFQDEGISYGAARALAALGPEAGAATRHLERQLAAASPRTRTLCALALWRVGRRPAAIATLRKELRGGLSLDRQWAAWALEQCGTAAAPAAAD